MLEFNIFPNDKAKPQDITLEYSAITRDKLRGKGAKQLLSSD